MRQRACLAGIAAPLSTADDEHRVAAASAAGIGVALRLSMSSQVELKGTEPDRTHVPTEEDMLRAEHDELEALTRRVSEKVVQGDARQISAAVSLLQSRVLAHLDSEERDLFERYAIHAPQDASRLVREHAEIRQGLASLDVSVDLRLLRADAVDAFLASLRAHAERENGGLYRWWTALGEAAHHD